MFGDSTYLFEKYVKGKSKAIFPWSLSIVDCFFVSQAFKALSGDRPIELARISDSGRQRERALIKDAYDLYDIDSDADGFEIVLTHGQSGSSCYWDVHERFVVVCGTDEFLALARPYPVDIEKHRYVEAMLYLEDSEEPEKPESLYEELRKL
jgi:hypothetical protein